MKDVIINNQALLQELIELVKSAELPTDDINISNNLFKAYYDDTNNILLGCGGLELYGHYALLRSLAVAPSQRSKSFGKEIVQDIIGEAKKMLIEKIYLLTETAPDFFTKLGFKSIARDLVPHELKASSEFTSVCPVSAICMELVLKDR
ncbi:MAG: arsenic resistance N-acetyltransferase ArsN2 [Chryseolinea sp.]